MACVGRTTWFVNGRDAVSNHVVPDLHLQLFCHAVHHGPVETFQTSSHTAGAAYCGQVGYATTEED